MAYDDQILGAEQQRLTSQKLRQQAMEPLEGQMVSGWYVKPSLTQYLAKGLNAYVGAKGEKDAAAKVETLRGEKQKAIAEALKSFPKERKAPVYSNEFNPQFMASALRGEPMTEPPTPQPTGYQDVKPTEQDYMNWALETNQIDPATAQMGMKMYEMDASRQARQEEARKAEELKREQMVKSFDLRREQMARDEQLRRDLANQSSEDRRIIAGAAKGAAPAEQWKYDAGSDQWVAPPNEQFPQGRVTANIGKTQAAKNFEYLYDRAMGSEGKPGVITQTQTGGPMGIMGQIGRVTDSQQQKEFNNLREQVSTEMRALFRIPGEGTLSDKEQAQYGIQLPDINNDPELNASIMNDLKVRINNKVAPVANPLTPQSGGVDIDALLKKYGG